MPTSAPPALDLNQLKQIAEMLRPVAKEIAHEVAKEVAKPIAKEVAREVARDTYTHAMLTLGVDTASVDSVNRFRQRADWVDRQMAAEADRTRAVRDAFIRWALPILAAVAASVVVNGGKIWTAHPQQPLPTAPPASHPISATFWSSSEAWARKPLSPPISA